MGCVHGAAKSKLLEEEIIHSRDVDSFLKTSANQSSTVFKILLLGTGESGKSTIFKQMQLLYAEGFSQEEKQTFRVVIRRNVIDCITAMIRGIEKHDIELSSRAQSTVADLLGINADDQTNWDSIVKCIRSLWLPDSKGKKEAAFEQVQKRSNVHIPDAAVYFLDAIDRIAASDYVPTADDIIRARLRTTGIVEKDFKINESNFLFVDVGGQRTERRKWIHCFDGVTAVIFMTAISEYNQSPFEDGEQSRLHESLRVFKETVSNAFLKDVAFIIFFNKYDLFVKKIRDEPLSYFPEEKSVYKGDGSATSAAEFIRDQFTASSKNHKLYSHFTTATDTQNCERVFRDVKNFIHQINMEECGLQ